MANQDQKAGYNRSLHHYIGRGFEGGYHTLQYKH